MSSSNKIAKIALLGNPNSGKTTIFNLLTGEKQKTANYSGVTISKKTSNFLYNKKHFQVSDLPGIYNIDFPISDDEKITKENLTKENYDLIINVIDGTNFESSLILTQQLLKLEKKIFLIINMEDILLKKNIKIDIDKLAKNLNIKICFFSKNQNIDKVKNNINNALKENQTAIKPSKSYKEFSNKYLSNIIDRGKEKTSFSDIIDKVVLNKFLGSIIFLSVMYFMFFLTINIGGAFIDFFDIISEAIFVDLPHRFLNYIHAPNFLKIIIADGIGGGAQIVCTFIPIIAFLYLCLSFLEYSGYMARGAFITNSLMNRIGLSGRAFIPLIIGFGCGVPSIMSTRILESTRERMTTIMMSPFFSCGAKLPVYVLFTAAFFPKNGQNIVFLLYLIGIFVAIFTGLIINKIFNNKKHNNDYIIELPSYKLPSLSSVCSNSFAKVKDFTLGAGKLIIIITTILTILNSIHFGKTKQTDNSILSYIGKSTTYIFTPIGITKENWPAGVGIFTGLFAKEVLVGTLDNLYNSFGTNEKKIIPIKEKFKLAILSIKENFAILTQRIFDPLGIKIGDVSDQKTVAKAQEIEEGTFSIMRDLFKTKAAAFAYLLFILLYTPCASVIGAIYRELNLKWAIIVSSYSSFFAYFTAIIFYQLATFKSHALSSSIWISSIVIICYLLYYKTKSWYAKQPEEIPFEIKLNLGCGECSKSTKCTTSLK